MSAIRLSYFSAIAATAILLATTPSNALPTGAATSDILAGMGNDVIVQVAHRGGGPAMRGSGPQFRGGPSFGGPRFGGPRFGGPQFRGAPFAWRGQNFRSRRFVGSPFFYGYPGYGYCRRVFGPVMTPRGLVMAWVRRCPGLYPYSYGYYGSYWW